MVQPEQRGTQKNLQKQNGEFYIFNAKYNASTSQGNAKGPFSRGILVLEFQKALYFKAL